VEVATPITTTDPLLLVHVGCGSGSAYDRSLMTGPVILAAVFVAYSLVASRLDRVSVSAPLVFVAAGIVVGPAVLDLLPAAPSREASRLLAELTLAVLLFADASTVPLRDVEAIDVFLGGSSGSVCR